MTRWEAIETRISCRAFQETFLPAEILEQLEEKIEALNAESGLGFRLLTSDDPARPAVKLAGAMFSGKVYAVAVLIGSEDRLSAEKVGYYGQELVLFATQLGLGTCWVAGTYDAKSLDLTLAEGEKIWDVIPMGYAPEKMPRKQTMIRSAIRRKSRKLEQFVESQVPFAELPDWVKKGAEAVSLGPSAVNQQPVNILWHDGRAFAKLWKDGHGLGHNDLGIAKKQFEAGAEACGVIGTWQFGDGGEFIITPDRKENPMSIYDYSVKSAGGEDVSLAGSKGKVILIVNTATGCGFTPQYAPIEQMYRDYHDKGLDIIDIPCNQFGGQTPGTDEEIHEFCTLHYNTTFPQMRKSDVNGENELPLYAYLKSQKGFEGFPDGPYADLLDKMLAEADPDYAKKPDIKWNFTKFVVNRQGEVVARFEPTADMAEVEACVVSLL